MTPREATLWGLLEHLPKDVHVFEIPIPPDEADLDAVTRRAAPRDLSNEKLSEKVRQVTTTGKPLNYREAKRAEDVRTWWRVQLQPVKEGEQTVSIFCCAREESQQRLVSRAIRKEDAIYQRLFELLPDAVIFTDTVGRILHINSAGVRLLGGTQPTEVLGLAVWDMLAPEEVLRARERGRLVRRGERVDLVEHKLIRLNGSTVPIETITVPVRYQGKQAFLTTARDISGREQAAAAERESRDLFYRIFHASPAAVAIIRLGDGRFLDINDLWSRLTGYDAKYILGRTVAEVDLWDTEAGGAAPPPGEQGALHDLEMTLRTEAGHERTVLASFQQIQVKGEPCLLTVMTDISDRKAMEMELVRSKNHAEQMSRMKTAFLTNMTHEVRTPLTVILGFTSMLRQGVRDEYQRFVRVIERSGRRLLLMLDSILDLAQLEAGSLIVEQQLFNVTDIVRNEADSFRPVAEEKGLTFALNLPSERAPVRADHKIFVRVLNNIFDNAVKFTEEGSITLSIQADNQSVRTIIEDTGIGIDPSFLPRIFDEFSQESTGLERTHQGSGLGLAVSRRLLELIGGNIEVESRKGKGSRFIITLPRAAGKMKNA